MTIPDSFINSLPDNPLLATKELANEVVERLLVRKGSMLSGDIIEDLAFYAAFRDRAKIPSDVTTPFKFPEHTTNAKQALEVLSTELAYLQVEASHIHSRNAAAKAAERVRQYFENKEGVHITYEFTDREYGDLQEKLNQFRDAVRDSHEITEGHKTRILRKIERVQSELHKKITATESLYGLVIDAAVITKKYGPQIVRVWTIGQAIFSIITEVVKRAEDITGGFYLEPPLTSSHKNILDKTVDIESD